MSRSSHLPPRCPHHSRLSSTRSLDSPSQTIWRDDDHRFPSQGSLLEEDLSWLDVLLTDPRTSPKERSHRRSASDSLAILEVAAAFQSPVAPLNEINPISITASHKSAELTEGSGCGFEASCMYGPNSPRQKSTLTNSESSIVTALLENVPRNPLQYVSVDFPSDFNISDSDVIRDAYVGAGDADAEKAARRRSGQRSRVRKLQYITELERDVDVFQTMSSELVAGIASRFQQRVALFIENKKLKQQLVLLRQEKMIKDDQYQSLRNEVERLKAVYGCHRKSKSVASYFEMLDLGKLSLGGSQVCLKNGIGR